MALKRIFEGFGRLSLIGMGAGVVVSGFNMTSNLGSGGAAQAEAMPGEISAQPASLERNLRSLAVSANAWKAVGVSEALEDQGAHVATTRVDGVRRLAAAAALDADDASLREYATLEQSGRVEVSLGMWSVEELDEWAGRIVSLDARINEVIDEVQVDLMASGLREDEASLLARGLLLASSVEARFGGDHPVSRTTLAQMIDEDEPEAGSVARAALGRIDAGIGRDFEKVMERARFTDRPVPVAMEF